MSVMSEVQTRLGFVYIVRRADLKICYVGQSVHTGRPYKHLKPGTYQYDELHVGGIVPTVEIAQRNVPMGVDLDSAESSWMRQVVADGWRLINRMGPDATWPHIPFECMSRGGKNGGIRGGTRTKQHRDEDPEFDAHWREVAAKAGGTAAAAKRLTDPEFAEKMAKAGFLDPEKGAKRRQHLRQTDPEWAAREREIGRRGGLAGGKNGGNATSKIRRVCNDCNIAPTTPCGMAWHLKGSGHSGYTQLAPLPTVTER